MTSPTTPPATLSVQLYSIRPALAEDRPAALARLAAAGLRWVEPFGVGSVDPAGAAASRHDAAELRRDLDAAGLRASSAHATFPEDLEALAEELSVLGADTVFLPVPSAAPGTARDAFDQRATVDALADHLAGAAEELGRHGIAVGYHNHWFEWADLGGELAYDRFLARCGPAVTIELDAYWALQAGQDPAALARRLGERVLALHVKSGPPRDQPLTDQSAKGLSQVPLTEGSLDVEALMTASSARWHVLEVDHTDGDPFDLIEANAATLLARGWSVS